MKANLTLVDSSWAGRKLHTCSICGKVEPWLDTWAQYGSLLDEEEGKQVNTCSENCRKVFSTDMTKYYKRTRKIRY